MTQTFTAKLNGSRVGFKKVDLIRAVVAGKAYTEAKRALKFMPNKGAELLGKVLSSAAASAKEKGVADRDLVISEIVVNKGMYYKRVHPASRGRMHKIQKPTTHITVKLNAVEEKKEDAKK